MKNIIFLILIGILSASCTFNDDGNRDGNPVTPPSNKYVALNPSPRDGSADVDNLVKLSWESESADSFRILLDTSNPPKLLGRSDVNTKSATVYAQGYNKIYYWQVISILDDGTEVPSEVWSFITKSDHITEPGFIMLKHSLSTETPNKVKILFQVLDVEEKGITNLTTNDFIIWEDAQKISLLESSMKITKRQDNPYVLRTVLMLDNSSSITASDPNNLQQIKNAAKDFVYNMIDQQEIAVYMFSSNPVQIIDFTGKANQVNIINAINSITPGAKTTNLYGAVIEGANRLKETYSATLIQQSYMILFTDGDDTQGSKTLSNALDAVAGKKVYTVGLGADIDPEILDLIATEAFFKIDQTNQLTQIFAEIQLDITKYANSFYWLEYESPKRGNRDHLLQLMIKDNVINSFVEGTFSSAGFFDPIPGIYFNSSFGDPLGEKELGLVPGAEGIEIQVKTYGGSATKEPFYSWQSDPNLYLNYLNSNRSAVKISALSNAVPGTKIEIQVVDVVNGFSKSINFVILSP